MPAIGNAQTFMKVPAKPPAPPPKPAPVANLTTGNNPRGVAIVQPKAAAPAPKVVPPQALPHGTGTLPKVTPGVAQPASAYNVGQPYAKTVLQVFRSQALPQQKAIVAGALQNPHIPESQIVLSFLKGAGNLANTLEPAHGQNVLAPVGNLLGNLGHASLSAVYGGGANANKGAPGGDYGAVMFGGPKEAPKLL